MTDKKHRSIVDHIRQTGDCSGFAPKPASEPCSYRPGSEDKIQLLMARVEAGEELFHDDDVTCLAKSETVRVILDQGRARY